MASEFIERLKAGQIPPPIVALIAKGAFPLPPEDSVAALVQIQQDSGEELRAQAATTLDNIPSATILDLLRAPDCDQSITYFFADYAERNNRQEFLEAILQNAATSDEYVAFLASRLPANLLDIIVTNQIRLIRSPQIMDAIDMNPQATRDLQRRVREVREEFFVKKAAAKGVPVGASQSEEAAPSALVRYGEKQAAISGAVKGEALAKILPAEALAALDPEERAEGITPERLSVYQKIYKMTVPQRVELAIKGSREERSILIRDPNRIVVEGVLASPKLSEVEVEMFSSMRSLNEEVLRKIAVNREWIKNYKVVLNLVTNPKTPVPTALGFLSRLHERDVHNLSRSKNVADVLRKAASRLVITRSERGH